MNRRRSDHRPVLYLWTATTIITGVLALAWSATTFPLDELISLTSTGGREGILLGLIFWIALGLLGGLRVERLHGHGVLTFHFPFIIAATALGGPTAGGLVAMISTIERRELREVPWYGTLANHTAYTSAAIAGGVVMLAVRDGLGAAVPSEPQAVELVAIVLGSLVLAVTATGIAAVTIVLRDRLTYAEAVRVYDSAYRTTAAAEVVLGWLLWLTYSVVGWWAAAICAMFVLVMWSAFETSLRTGIDPLSGLLRRDEFDARLAEALAGVQRRGRSAALLSIDLDGFKAVNDRNGHATGDEVIRAVGARLRRSIRLIDAAARRGGDEFEVLLVDVPDRATAVALAGRILDTIREPIELDDRTVAVGASIGLYVIEPSERVPSVGRLHDLTDRLMFAAKRAGGGLRVDERSLAALGAPEGG